VLVRARLLVLLTSAGGVLSAPPEVAGASLLAEASALRGRSIEVALPELLPSAAAMAAIALGAGETHQTLRPLYLRPPDARPQAAGIVRR